MQILYLLAGFITGSIISWLIARFTIKHGRIPRTDFDALADQYNRLATELGIEKEKARQLAETVSSKEADLKNISGKHTELTGLLAASNTEYTNLKKQSEELRYELQEYKKTVNSLQQDIRDAAGNYATVKASLDASLQTGKTHMADITQLKTDLQNSNAALNEAHKQLSALSAHNQFLAEKLQTQQSETEELRKQFNTSFENIANKILEEKTAKFTRVNQENLHAILKPLGENIDSFKKKVEEVYEKESKERFSLGKEVEKLVLLNQKVSEEANNLTNALKGNSKVQGDWGQMILENILEKSGLAKDREYFVQEFLKDEDGNYHKNEDGGKMQPDVIIAYPDNRKVIVDAKVSLTAYTRYTAAATAEEQQKASEEHLRSLRRHIEDLSRKNYQDFAPALDFVMLFVPNEPAYLLALQQDAELWHFAYNKRILLISPTNLIAALKLIADLWKREYQNRNAQEIAKRGAALYDKLANFADSLMDVGTNLNRAKKSYDTALGQLKDGQGNLLWQAEKLKELGIKPKKNLPASLLANLPDETGNNEEETEEDKQTTG